jgi:class 3 adenylate cyclase
MSSLEADAQPRAGLAQWLAALSPWARLDTSAPGARVLLARAEADAERVLHVIRLAYVTALTVVLLFVFRLADVLPLAIVTVPMAVAAALWIAVRRHLARGCPSFRFRCGLILFDGVVLARTILVLQKGSITNRLYPQVAEGGFLTPAHLQVILPPMLVFLAVTGAFRLEPRLAAFSTAVALAVYGYLVAAFPQGTAPTVANGVVILLAGTLGVNAARALRFIALKAAQEEVLEHYVPADLTRELARSGDPGRGGRVDRIAVLIADIRGFTRLAEGLGPAGTVALLNDYFSVTVAALALEGAVLDKYLGDGLLAFFEGPDHGARAVRAAHGVLEAVDRFNAARADGFGLRVGIAVHAGQALVGTIGAPARREYTIIGDVVNVTARLEECNKRLSARLTVSSDALRAGGPAAATGLTGPVSLELRGHDARVDAFYLPA